MTLTPVDANWTTHYSFRNRRDCLLHGCVSMFTVCEGRARFEKKLNLMYALY